MAEPTAANLLLVDVDSWDDILRGCASACAMDINSEMIWQEADALSVEGFLYGLANLGRLISIVPAVAGAVRHGNPFSVSGNEVVQFKNAKYRTDLDNFYIMFWNHLAREIVRGPQAATDYVASRITLARSAMANVHYKFRETRRINDEVSRAWDRGIRRLDAMQVLINATFAVGLSFVPGGVLVLTAAGVGYTLTCNLINTLAGVPQANAMGFGRRTGMDLAANTSTNIGQNAVKFGARNKLVASLAENTERTLLSRIAQFTAQSGGEQFSRGQRRSIARALASHRTALAAAERSAARAHYLAGGLGAAVTLVFMKDDLERAFCTIAEELAESE